MDITNFITNGCGNLCVLHHVNYLTIILPHNLLYEFFFFFFFLETRKEILLS